MPAFGLFFDAALTLPVTELETLHRVDGSLDPVDVQLWLGSTDDTLQLVAASDPGVDPLELSIEQAVPAWSAAASITTGQRRRPTTTNNRVYQATSTGTTAGTEPTWPTTIGATVADGGVTWQAVAAEDTPDEVKLAATSGGLAGATAGAPLSLGTEVLGGAANAATFWLRRVDPDARTQSEAMLTLTLTEAEEVPA